MVSSAGAIPRIVLKLKKRAVHVISGVHLYNRVKELYNVFLVNTKFDLLLLKLQKNSEAPTYIGSKLCYILPDYLKTIADSSLLT